MTVVVKGIMGFRRTGRDNLRRLRSTGDEGMQRRDWSKAIKFYQDYLIHRPSDAAILVQFGHALKETQQFSAAKTAYSKAVAAAPDDRDAQFHLQNILQILGKLDVTPISTELGQEIHETVSAGLPAVKGASDELASTPHNSIADQERDRKNWHRAAFHYSEHLKGRIDDAPIWVQLGHMLKEASFFEEAIYAYRVAKRLEQRPSDVSIHLANLLAIVGRASDAQPLWGEMFRSQKTFFLAGT